MKLLSPLLLLVAGFSVLPAYGMKRVNMGKTFLVMDQSNPLPYATGGRSGTFVLTDALPKGGSNLKQMGIDFAVRYGVDITFSLIGKIYTTITEKREEAANKEQLAQAIAEKKERKRLKKLKKQQEQKAMEAELQNIILQTNTKTQEELDQALKIIEGLRALAERERPDSDDEFEIIQ